MFDRIHRKSEHTELPIICWPLPNNSSLTAGREEGEFREGGEREKEEM